jgi:acetolactate synthase-1/2/3 large subunit
VSFAIPPSKLIQIDVDPREIGKNYPVEAALVGDAQAALRDLLDALRQATPSRARTYRDLPYFDRIQRVKGEWEKIQAARRDSPDRPITQTRALHELRQALDRRTIVTSGAGVVQASVRQDFPVYEPRTHLTSGGYSTMGFTVPAAIGAKLAQPDRPVVGIAGDGDFMQTMQEMATAAMLGTPVLFVVLNNSGWISIKGGQLANFGRIAMTDFQRPDGTTYSPAYAEVARNFGLHGEKVDDPANIGPAVRRAIATHGPALLEITVARDYPLAGATKAGWWDAPVPAYLPEQRRAYEAGRAEEQA